VAGLATLVIFAREMEVILIDAAITMFDRLIGRIAQRAELLHKERLVDKAKSLGVSARMLVDAGKALMAARNSGSDALVAIDRAIGWDAFVAVVLETEGVIAATGEDGLSEIVSHYPMIRKAVPAFLGAFQFRSWQRGDPLLSGLDLIRNLYATGRRALPAQISLLFLKESWRRLIDRESKGERDEYEVAVLVHLRDRLRAGDVWVVGSRAFRAFDEFLLPQSIFSAMRAEDALGLAVPQRFSEWMEERRRTLGHRLQEVAAQAVADTLPEAVITEDGLSISPIRRSLSEEAA
jgi:hypothetical protein